MKVRPTYNIKALAIQPNPHRYHTKYNNISNFSFSVQQPNLSHPFHLHGYAFNVIGIGRSPDRNVKKINLKHALDLDRQGLLHRQFNLPPAKDTIAVPNNGYVVLRFRANNPGYWLFHCHFLFHIVIGMNLILHVGTHADLPPVPPNFPTCGNHLPPMLI